MRIASNCVGDLFVLPLCAEVVLGCQGDENACGDDTDHEDLRWRGCVLHA